MTLTLGVGPFGEQRRNPFKRQVLVDGVAT